MKEIKFDSSLNSDIKESNANYSLKDNLLTWITIYGMMSIFSIIAYYVIMNFSSFLGLMFLVITGVTTFIGELVKTHKQNIKKQNSRRRLKSLSETLNEKGLNVNLNSLKQAITTEERSMIESVNNIGQGSFREEIITHFYMLDENDQIKVLQETLRNYRSFDNKDFFERKLFLLENEDLKDIDMPNIVKKLSFDKK